MRYTVAYTNVWTAYWGSLNTLVYDRVCKYVFQCTRKIRTKIFNSWSPVTIQQMSFGGVHFWQSYSFYTLKVTKMELYRWSFLRIFLKHLEQPASTLSWRTSLSYRETSPMICYANQWNGLYMIKTSVMKELKLY